MRRAVERQLLVEVSGRSQMLHLETGALVGVFTTLERTRSDVG